MKGAGHTRIAITAVHAVTAVGHDAVMTGASVNAGITRLVKSGQYLDRHDRPVTTARIKGLDDHPAEEDARMSSIAAFSLEQILGDYFANEMYRPDCIHLFLGGAYPRRPGPRYADRAATELDGILKKFAAATEIQLVPQGNAAALEGLSRACGVLGDRPLSLCIVGALDSLLHNNTLDWFEQDRRLKSESPGRHQALVPGQAAGFILCESTDHARQRQKPVLAVIQGLGLALDPEPFVSQAPGTAQGLTQAMRTALKPVAPEDIHTLLCDQNGEHYRARQWHYARMRCFDADRAAQVPLYCPAENYGDTGAASGALLVALAAEGLRHGRFQEYILIACADDHGPCGAVVLGKQASILNEGINSMTGAS